jgi:hypothetical protein
MSSTTHAMLALAAAICLGAPAFAHHSRAEFDAGAVVVLDGTVTAFNWKNPHVSIVLTTMDGGRRVEWEVEADGIPLLTRSGWTPASLAPGDVVRVRALPNRDAARHRVLLLSVTTSAGTTLEPRRRAAPAATARAKDLSGVWELPNGDDTGDFPQRWGAVPLTPRGAAAKAQFRPEDRPAAKCIAPPTPMIMAMPYLNQIELRTDTVVLRNEFFNVERTVYMDGRRHPANGPRTNQGHSIGRWEGDVLVVDTVLFEDHRAPIRGRNEGVPSGAQRHVVERYRVSDDRTRLVIDFVVDDPEYLAKPFTGTLTWVYAPHLPMLSYNCQP